MLEPSLDFQTALRSALIASSAVTALVPVQHIRSGSTRPDRTPCIILANPSTEFLGRAAGSQMLARVSIDLHIWATEDGADTAKLISFAASLAILGMTDEQDGFWIDDLDQPATIFLRDPQPEISFTHGVLSVEAVIRWRT